MLYFCLLIEIPYRITNMKNFFFILTVLLLVACGSQEKAKDENTLLIDRPAYSISFPKTWDPGISENSAVDLLMKTPPENANDRFMENVNVLIQETGTMKLSLEEYADISEKQLKQVIHSSQVLKKNIFKHNGVKCLELAYDAHQEDFDLAYLQRVYLHKDKAFILTFTAEKNSYNRFEKDVKVIFDSFKLK